MAVGQTGARHPWISLFWRARFKAAREFYYERGCYYVTLAPKGLRIVVFTYYEPYTRVVILHCEAKPAPCRTALL